jgi:hypothetical protein
VTVSQQPTRAAVREVSADAAAVNRPPPRRSTAARRAAAVLVGAAVGAGCYAVLSSGLLPGRLATCLPLLLVVLTPTAAALAPRVALNGILLLAWAPALWWVPLPWRPDQGALLVAGWVAALVAWSAATPVRTRLLPVLGSSAVLVAAATGVTVLAVRAWVFAGSAQGTLAMLLPGYDNSAHFDIFSMMLRQGAMLDSLSRPPDGSSWSLQYYPQGFHALAATFAQLSDPGVTRGPEALVVYAHSVGLLVVTGTAVVVAALCTLPGLRSRPLVAAPAVVAVCALFVWGPGHGSLVDGFANFWLAGLAGACALVLAVDVRRTPVLRWLAVASALVVVANAWAPLLVVCGPASLAVLTTGGRRSLPSDARGRVLGAVVVLAACVGGLRAAWMLARVAQQDAVHAVITAAGGITNPSPLPTLGLVPVSVVVFLGFAAWLRTSAPEAACQELGTPVATARSAVRRLVLVTCAAVGSLAVLVVLQLRTLHAVSYYFFKYFVGCELVLAPVTVAVAAMWVALALPTARPGRSWLTASGLLCVVATQCWGSVGWQTLAGATPVWHDRTTEGARLPAASVARGVLDAASVDAREAERSEYFAIRASAASGSVLPATWFHALDGGLTTGQQARFGAFMKPVTGVAQAGEVVERLLSQDPGVRVLVAPEYLDAVRGSLGDRALARRVTTWPTSGSVQPEGER